MQFKTWFRNKTSTENGSPRALVYNAFSEQTISANVLIETGVRENDWRKSFISKLVMEAD